MINVLICYEIGSLYTYSQIDCGQLDGEQFSKENGFAGYFETSAKTGVGVEEAIHFMVKKVGKQVVLSNVQSLFFYTMKYRYCTCKTVLNKGENIKLA